jgi:osmoprotectant transport system ATP-binding protein
VGGKLEQYAPPEEILRAPANSFVEEFVGAERGLKRLALIRVADIEVEEGPVVSPNDTTEKARAVMREFGFDWTSVIKDGELLGWVDDRMLDGTEHVGAVTPRKFSAYVTGDDSLRQALDSIATSRTNVAVVVTEAQQYRGILTIERISEEIVS